MTKSKKIVLGFFTLFPLLCIFAYVVFFFQFFFESITTQTNDPFEDAYFFQNFIILFILIIVGLVTGFAMMIYYIIHANSNPRFDSNQKLMWILILVFSSFLGSIIYYFIQIIPDKQVEK